MVWQSGRRAVTMLALALSALVVAGCGDDDSTTVEPTSGDGDSADGTTTTEPTSTTLSPEEQVLADYRAAREAIFAAYDPPDPTDPDLVARVDGEALASVQNSIGLAQADGVSYTGPFELNPRFVNMAGDEAVVEDCATEHTQRVDTQTSEPVGATIDLTHHDRIDLQRIDGTWKIVRIEELDEPCTP